MTNGKAYFANPGNLSQFVLIDFCAVALVGFTKPFANLFCSFLRALAFCP